MTSFVFSKVKTRVFLKSSGECCPLLWLLSFLVFVCGSALGEIAMDLVVLDLFCPGDGRSCRLDEVGSRRQNNEMIK